MLSQSKTVSAARLAVVVEGRPLRTHVELDKIRQHVNADSYRMAPGNIL